MSVGSSRRRAVQKFQGTFEGAKARKERLAREAKWRLVLGAKQKQNQDDGQTYSEESNQQKEGT